MKKFRLKIRVQVLIIIQKHSLALDNKKEIIINFLDQLLNVLQITKIQSKNYKMLGQELMEEANLR